MATAALRTPEGEVQPEPAPHVVFMMGNLHTGGVQRMTTLIAEGLAAKGANVDLVACDAKGGLKEHLPPSLRLIELKPSNPVSARVAVLRSDPHGFAAYLRPLLTIKYASPTLAYLPAMANYLRSSRPDSVFSATTYLNIETVLAKRLAAVPSRLIISDRSHFSSGKPRKAWRQRNLVAAMQRTYLQADAITAVSNGVADDISRSVGVPRERITTLYNPTLTPDFADKLRQPTDHPWFAEGEPPVLLAIGRTTFQKDFTTLLRAFARVRSQRPARLAIIGEAKDKQTARLQDLAAELGVQEDFDLLGYRPNPLPYIARAGVFVLSSRYEGFPNVLLEAIACGTPVVSTDCPSGPFEILDGGAFGRLVPVADDAALADAIVATLADPPDPARLRARAATFDYPTAMARYADVILGRDASAVRSVKPNALTDVKVHSVVDR